MGKAERSAMNMRRALIVAALALAMATAARSGHELPVYPSYYPHEIEFRTIAPDDAAVLLSEAKLHAYIGGALRFPGAVPEHVQEVDTVGSYVVVRVNSSSPQSADEKTHCAIASAVLQAIAASPGDVILHPYPIMPLHGDYLNHVDLAAAAKARLLDERLPPADGLKVKADGFAKNLIPAAWRASSAKWDAEIVEVRIADLIGPRTVVTNAWEGPPSIRAGWLQAYLLLGGNSPRNLDSDVDRLQVGEFKSAAERINLERDLVTALTSRCHTTVAGYRMKREYINNEFSAGVENLAFDALTGLNTPVFLRTVKLKDFPWNGWLALGLEDHPHAAWNPIAGFTDPYGRLLWSAIGDPAALPSPYDDTWMLNRISEVQISPKR